MKDTIQSAILDMSRKVERDSKHVYREPVTGEMYQGVSTVSSIVPKDWLAAWGAKECVKFFGYSDYPEDTKLAKETLEKIKNIQTPEEWILLLKEAKGASSRKSKQALVDGKKGHEWLELYVQAQIQGSTLPLVPTAELERPITQFLEWEKENVDYWIASEALVVYPEKRYAGQLDAIYISKSGRLCLADFKFASHLSEDYVLQEIGYGACFEQYGIKFDDYIIIRLPKTLQREEWNEKEFKYEMKPNDIEVKKLDVNYEQTRDTFFACLIVKAWINYITKHNYAV